MKFWQVALIFGLGFLLAYYLFGRVEPPPKIITVTKTDTALRVDTVETVPPRLKARLAALEAAGRVFLVDTVNQTLDTCLGFVAAFLTEIDSLKAALRVAPAVRLTLSDSLRAKYPITAFWVGVSYKAEGDSATRTWDYRLYPAPLAAKGRLGAVISYGREGGLGIGGQFRLNRQVAIQAVKAKKSWQFGAAWFLF